MSRQSPHVAGAEAPQRPDDQDLQDVVTDFLNYSIKEQENLNRFSVSDCDYVLQGLVEYANHPARKPRLILPDLLGKMFLFHQRRAQLLAAEREAQLSQLQHSYQAELEENRRLRQNRLRSAVEIHWLREDKRILRTQLQSAQLNAEDRHKEGQTGQTSTAVDTAKKELSDVPDLKEVPHPGVTSRSLLPETAQVKEQMTPLHQEVQARSLATPGNAVADLISSDDCEAPPSAPLMDVGSPPSSGAPPSLLSRCLLQKAAQVKEQMSPVCQEMQASSLATPGDAVADLASPDNCQAPPSAHLMDAGAPPSDGAPPSILSHTTSCPDRRWEDHSQAESGVGASGPPLTSELHALQSLHPCPDETPQGRSRPPRHGDLSDSGVSDVSDSPPPRRRRGLHTQQLEPPASNVDRFDPDNQNSDINDYLMEVECCPGDLPHPKRPARGHKDDPVVLWIHTSGDANLALEGNKTPRAKTDGRTGPLRRRPPRQRGEKQNQWDDDQTHPPADIFQPLLLPKWVEQPPHRRGVDPLW